MIIRLFDILGAIVGIVLASPIMLVAAVAIRLDSPGPVIFRQQRVAKDNLLFTIYKFRSMTVGTPDIAKSDLASQMNVRVTKVGQFLRRSSIDELPQLFNVLKGDMSLVGPRPALYNQTELIHMRTAVGVHRMRPGLTGLAQINGREDMSLAQKVQFDLELMRRLDPIYYVQIMLRTFVVVFADRGTF